MTQRPLRLMLASAGLAAALTGCFIKDAVQDRRADESAPPPTLVDIVFVIDNSSSMQDEASALATSLAGFADTLLDRQQSSLIDAQIGVTTTSVEVPGNNPDLPGVYGQLVGSTPLVAGDSPSLAGLTLQSLLCEATCWDRSTLPTDPDYSCAGTPDDASAIDSQPAQISREYLDCLCGPEAWEDHCGSGNEEPLESAVMALCRAVEEPPPSCYVDSPFTEADALSSAGLARDGATVVFVVVTDEGDTSRRLDNGDADPQPYVELLSAFGAPSRFAVVGPNYDYEASTLVCNSGGATTWGSRRLQLAAEYTGGFYTAIAGEDAGGACASTDFAEHLDALVQLLDSL